MRRGARFHFLVYVLLVTGFYQDYIAYSFNAFSQKKIYYSQTDA